MIKLKIKDIEKKVFFKVKKNYKTAGFDTASRTGWAKVITDDENLYLDYGFVEIKSSDVEFKYNEIIPIFNDLIEKDYEVVVEDTFLKYFKPGVANVKGFKLITRIGAIAYTLAKLKGCKASFCMATEARHKIEVKGNAKKVEVMKSLKNMFDINIDDNDIADAIVLALGAVLV
jgi:Holliday junction resolvasome RuvABC endonuclease subunit